MAPWIYYALIIVMVTFGQSLNVFSIWWIGKARNPTWGLSTGAIVGIYVSLVCVYGIMLFLSGILICVVSMSNTEKLANQLMDNLERCDVFWV